MEHASEIARFRAQIEQEHQAMVWALTGLSQGSTQHAFISRRMGHTEIACQGLSKLVGEEEALRVVTEVWEKTPSQQH
jgi:hypothetical protein